MVAFPRREWSLWTYLERERAQLLAGQLLNWLVGRGISLLILILKCPYSLIKGSWLVARSRSEETIGKCAMTSLINSRYRAHLQTNAHSFVSEAAGGEQLFFFCFPRPTRSFTGLTELTSYLQYFVFWRSFNLQVRIYGSKSGWKKHIYLDQKL